jgi:hypothetical protein
LLKIAKFCTLILKSKLLGPQVEQWKVPVTNTSCFFKMKFISSLLPTTRYVLFPLQFSIYTCDFYLKRCKQKLSILLLELDHRNALIYYVYVVHFFALR